MSKAQRDKGKRLAREVVAFLQAVYPDARRSANQAGGAVQPDIDGTPWWVEVSGGARPNILGKMRQAEGDSEAADDIRPELVIVKRDREPWTVTMWLGDFIDLARRAEYDRA